MSDGIARGGIVPGADSQRSHLIGVREADVVERFIPLTPEHLPRSDALLREARRRLDGPASE